MEVGEEAKWQHTLLMRGTSQNIILADVSAPKIRYKLSPMFDNCFSRNLIPHIEMVIIFEILVSIKVPVGTNSRRSSRGVSQQSQEEQMRRSMSLASQQEAPTRYQEEENPYNHQPSEMNGRRVSEANYPAQNRYDRSNNVRINNFNIFIFA